MTSLQVRNVEKFQLQRKFYRQVQKICSNHGRYEITEIAITEN